VGIFQQDQALAPHRLRETALSFASSGISTVLIPPRRAVSGFSYLLRSLDQQTNAIEGFLSIGRRISFGVHPSVRKCDLELDLLSAQGWRIQNASPVREKVVKNVI
jgi:hypothetical protein